MRAEERFHLLEQGRRERRAHARAAIREATRLPHVPSGRGLALIGGGALLLVVLALVLASSRAPKPLLERSCGTLALALARTVTGDGQNIAWAVTGSAAGGYQVTVDGATIASPPLPDCRAEGVLPPLPAGAHRVDLRHDGQVVASVTMSP